VIRRNQTTGKVSLDPLCWGLIPYWCEDPKGGRKRPSFLISRVIPVSVVRLEISDPPYWLGVYVKRQRP
jgi:putative SOS response-associated peptidase YedK